MTRCGIAVRNFDLPARPLQVRAFARAGVASMRTFPGQRGSSMGLRALHDLALACLQTVKTPDRYADLAEQLVQLAQHYQVEGFVVGLPTTTGGELWQPHRDSHTGRICRNFALTLALVARAHALPVFLVDEAGSTLEAEYQLAQLGRRGKGQVRRAGHMSACAQAGPSFVASSLPALLRCR